MKIVIEIPEEIYNSIQDNDYCGILNSDMYNAVKNGTPLSKGHERKFEEIVVEYPPAELCTYPEYKGKPYFSIKYEENGNYIGFGTFNPKVLSEYLREYFIAQTNIENVGEMSEKQTDGDLISRTDLLKDIADLKKSPWFNDGKDIKDLFRHNSYVVRKEAVEIIEDLCIKKLPSAENTAKWINETEETIECGNCHHIFDDFGLLNGDQEKFYEYPKFCPNCGRRMKGVSDGKTEIQSWQ